MRWIKLLQIIVKARFRPKVNGSETTRVNFRVWVTDIDVSVMNHAAIMTVFEMGRADFMVRTNFFKVATKNKWFFPNQAIHVQFYRPLKMFQRAEVYTRMSFVDDSWFYFEQKIMRKGKPVAACLANGLAKRGRETIATSKIIEALEIDSSKVPRKKHELINLFNVSNGEMTSKIIENWDM
ncbi:acyl-CoA thioesterase [Aestuariivivens sp. NBU2969]|uniref:acyl-CoA thioesterase n=1 Tax=Aestuariivivens sp. NBU2969 TaxID=2873267 RepID=UPI001CBFFD53|nr:acyl-CoA thioesterase [Aestuariivivens sp. NBU2969]